VAEVAAEVEDRQVAIVLGDLVDQPWSGVLAAVVNKNDLVGGVQRLHRPFKPTVQLSDIVLLVVQRDDYADLWGFTVLERPRHG
jgi:hypothetical protein